MSASRTPRTHQLVSQRAAAIPPSGIRKFFDLIAATEGVISLGVGEPDFVTPWHIREAAIYATERGHTHYTSNYGLLELRREVARHLEQRYGLRYDPATEVLITTGVSEGFDLAVRALIDPGDEVLCPEPWYVAYFPCVHLAGGAFVPVPTNMEEGFRVQPEAVQARITERSRLLILNYPNNPTGAVMDRETMGRVAEVAIDNGLTVLSDEIYDRLVYGVEHVCVPTLPGMRERSVLLGGFSKAYAMTGWRIGYAAGPAPVIEAMMKVHQYVMLSAPTIAQEAALEALRRGEAAVQEMLEAYDQRRRLTLSGLRSLGLACAEPQGAFYVFLSIAGSGLSSQTFAEQLLREEKVAVVPGSAFGASGEGFVRCCYAVSAQEIEEALERMGRFLARHRQ
ncbi:MAG: aminotransferase class I/II-fold pyridoxal phosphate-dependent enzyme [Chloroflexi bacterium]|nr:aminotransferase class I/II-fold pyridoxal phosphate-dependent enzyme [Chloroflexota bacterium]